MTVSSKIYITHASDSILQEIESLILKRKKFEGDFILLRKRLFQKKSVTVINSENWEDWKLLSLEYDEIKKIIEDIDERYLVLKRLRHELKKTTS
ncbi:MAG: hypothetical protein ACREA3_08755 [Nitrosotalea sp.]